MAFRRPEASTGSVDHHGTVERLAKALAPPATRRAGREASHRRPSDVGGCRADVSEGGFPVSRHRDIAEGDDAHDLAILLHDGQATDGLVADESHRAADARRGRTGGELAAADLSQRHRGGITPLRE